MAIISDDTNGSLRFTDGKVMLHLSSCIKNIGGMTTTDTGKRLFFKDISSKKHIMRVNNSIGFCYTLLQWLSDEDELWVRVDKRKTYKIEVSEAKKVGSFLHFKTQGFERQLFVQLNKFKQVND